MVDEVGVARGIPGCPEMEMGEMRDEIYSLRESLSSSSLKSRMLGICWLLSRLLSRLLRGTTQVFGVHGVDRGTATRPAPSSWGWALWPRPW